MSPEREADTRRTFKRADTAPHLLIVTDKLLTGYDAPLLYCLYLDKPMRDHVLLQAIARVNRPYVDASGARKRVGLVVDFVGVLRELRKALRFDSSDVSGAIEDLDLLMRDFHDKIRRRRGGLPARHGRQQRRRTPGADHLRALSWNRRRVRRSSRCTRKSRRFGKFCRRRRSCAAVSRPSNGLPNSMTPCATPTRRMFPMRRILARKTHSLVAESAIQEGLGYQTRTVAFDLRTLEALRNEPGPDEAKVFNLVRGLRQEIASEPDRQPVLLPLKERAERILKDLADRTASGLEAMERLGRSRQRKGIGDGSGKSQRSVSARTFGVHWTLKDDTSLRAAGIATLDLAQRAEALLNRFPNAAVNADEQRRLRAALYAPLLDLDSAARSRVVERIVTTLLGTRH